jgi:hypothetical protein
MERSRTGTRESMRKRMHTLSGAMLIIVPVLCSTLLIAQESSKSFPVYDNMFYRGKPATERYGLIPSNIVYENKIWPNPREVGKLPSQDAFQALVRKLNANPGPLVLDIESVSLRTAPDMARHNASVLATLADWAHEAAPGKIIGYYGTNTLTDIPRENFAAAQGLARHVDAFFPPLYTFDDDRSRWEKRAKTSLAQCRELDPRKPVYFYLWPQYHQGTPKALRYVDAKYWKFQLETALRYGDGIVIWSRSRDEWDPRSGWWDVTRQFVAPLQPQEMPVAGPNF